jgi:multicomponent Na+:H+ antiporter subunit D
MELVSNMFNKLIALHILLPVLGALLNIIFRKHLRIAQGITITSLLSLFATSLFMFLLSIKVNEYSYIFGGWQAPFGIELGINYYNALFLLLISGAALCSFLYGKRFLQTEMEQARIPIFNAIFLVCIFGMYGLVMTNDFFNLYVFIEINALTTYALVSWNSSNRNSLLAGFYYLIIGSVAAIFILIGIGYLYSASGTLNISHFMSKLPSIKSLRTVQLGTCLIALGLLIKSAIFPFQSWVLKVYKETNSFILPFLGASSNKIYLFVFAKLFYLGFFALPILKTFLLISGLAAIVIFSLRAIYSKDLRIILALSGLIQVGYVFILLYFEYKFSFLLITAQIASYSITSIALFMLAARFVEIRGSASLANLGGLVQQAPFYVALFIINSFSLIGLPATIGFLPKFGLFLDLIHNKSWEVLAIIALASFCTSIYIFKAINVFMFEKKISLANITKDTSILESITLVIITIANLLIGFVSLSYLKIFE